MLASKISLLKRRLKFVISFFQFIIFLKRSKQQSKSQNKINTNEYVFILFPWLLTTTPWFGIVIGLMLFKKNNVLYIIDDCIFENETDHKLQVKLIESSLKFLKKNGVKFEKLSRFSSQNSINQDELVAIKKLAFSNAIHKNRGEDDSTFFKELVESNQKKYLTNFSTVKSCVNYYSDKNFVFPGGIYADSGLFQYLLKINNFSFFTYDAGIGLLLATYKGIAAQLADIPLSFELINGNNEELNFAVLSAQQELEKRKNGTNKLNSQYQSFEDSLHFDEVGILIPLNSPWDAAALNIGTVFKSYNDWLFETVRLILDNSEYMVTIRQHPDERHWWGRSSTDFKTLIAEKFGNNERIQFITCNDKVNTYALLEKAEAVICYSSTFGIESVILNKRVCICSSVYYSKLEFAYIPKTKEDVVFFITNIHTDKITADINKASVAYYLGQQCNWTFTNFTPTIPDFNKWRKSDINTLSKESTVQTYLESLESLVPISYINHKNKYYGN